MLKTIKSENLSKKTLEIVGFSQFADLYGISIKSGKKNTIIDEDGNKYIDLLSGASVNCLGYSNKKILNTILKQIKNNQHSCFNYSINEQVLNLGKKIQKITKKENKILLGLSGSDANSIAIKCARRFTKRKRVISFLNSWHGINGFAHQANGFIHLKQGLHYDEGEFIHVPFPSTKEISKETIDIIKNEYKKYKNEIAAIIIECIQGDGGNLMPYKNSLKEIEEIAHNNGSLFIVDEIQSGIGRSGKFWEFENFKLKPDIITSAKALTGGYYPTSLCIARKEIIESLGKNQNVMTYAGNPVGAIIANKVIDTVNNQKFLTHVKEMGEIYKKELSEFAKKHKIIKEIRGLGLHLGLEMSESGQGALLGFLCINNGVYPGYFGTKNEVLRIHPPLTITKKEVMKSIEVIKRCIIEIEDNKIDKKILERFKKYAMGIGEHRI